MRVPTNGSSAYKYNDAAARKKSVKKTPAAKKKRIAKRRAALKNFAAIICVTLAAFMLLFRYAMITEKSSMVASMKEECQTLSDMVTQKQVENEKNIDLATVEQIARTRLGMIRPEKHQTVYVNMENCDYAQVAGDENNTEGVFTLFVGKVTKLLEYLH